MPSWNASIASYFEAERAESVFFVAVGLVAVALAVWCWRASRKPLHMGLAVPLALVAAIQITVGSIVFVRSTHDGARVQQMVQADPDRVRREEIPRMQAVMKNFVIYRWTEVALLVLGVLLLAFARPAGAWRGAGLGLAVQAGLMLALDFFAERRGDAYLAWLQSLR
jgi:hypothetical protein